MPKQLNVMSLNVGRLLQQRTYRFLQHLGIDESRPDVLCLQDIPFRDLSILERWPHIAFAPMTNHLINGVRAVVGIAIASRYFMTDIVHHTTWGNGVLKDLLGVNNQNQRSVPTEEGDRLIDSTEDRIAICATVIKDDAVYDIATTHGAWVRGGIANDRQRDSTECLRGVLVHEAVNRGGLVLAGDMNFSRGGEIYRMFSNTFCDCMPPEIDNTLDPDHPFVKKGGKVVADYVMTCEIVHGKTYQVSGIRLRSGVSDHCALFATISRT